MRQSCASLASARVNRATRPRKPIWYKLAAHRPQACLDIAKTLAVSQLSEGHCQILVATREASVVRITAVAGYTLLKLVGGQMLHQLGENSLAEIHLSLSAIATGARRTAFAIHEGLCGARRLPFFAR